MDIWTFKVDDDDDDDELVLHSGTGTHNSWSSKGFFLLLLTFLSWCFALGAIESPPIPTKEVLPFS